MPDSKKGLPEHPYPHLAVIAVMLYCPRLPAMQLVALLWLAPDRDRKVLRLAATYRHFRVGRDLGE